MPDSPRIIRKKTGNFLEDFRPGPGLPPQGRQDRHRGPLHDLHRVRDDDEPAREERALRARVRLRRASSARPASSMLVAFSQTVEDVSENARANLEYIDMRFGAPVYVGDTIEVETKVLGVRASASAPEPRHRPRAVDRAQERRRARRGGRAHLAAQGAGLQATTRAAEAARRARSPPDADRRASSGCRPTTPTPRLQGARAPLEPATPTSRTSSPARASSTRAAAR